MKLQKRNNPQGNEKKINIKLSKLLSKLETVSVHHTDKYKGNLITARETDSVMLDNAYVVAQNIRKNLSFLTKLFITNKKMEKLVEEYRADYTYICRGLVNRASTNKFYIEIRNKNNKFRRITAMLDIDGDKQKNINLVNIFLKNTTDDINERQDN